MLAAALVLFFENASAPLNDGGTPIKNISKPIEKPLQLKEFSFAAVGDWGCSANTKAVVDGIKKKNPEIVIPLGDYSYENSPACWYDEVAPIKKLIQRPAIGNHEIPSTSQSQGKDYLSAKGKADLIDRFSLTPTYGSFNYGNVHFLALDSESEFGKGSAQYNFALGDLTSAKANSSINWIVAYFHSPMYASRSVHQPNTEFRRSYQPLFDAMGVDLVLASHDHNYERSMPLKFDARVTASNRTQYNDPEGQVFVVVGTGGGELYKFKSRESYVAFQEDNTYGFIDVAIRNNGTEMDASFYAVPDLITLDKFSISKN